MKNNWFKTALATEPLSDSTQQATNAVSGISPLATQPPNPSEPTSDPQKTPTPTEKVQQGKAQQEEMGQIHNIVLPEIANKVLPTLNSSLYYLTNEIMSRDDLNLPQTNARGLAIEIMAAWLAASRQSEVSNLAGIVTKSVRINTIVNTSI
jgi:hypothetical protein